MTNRPHNEVPCSTEVLIPGAGIDDTEPRPAATGGRMAFGGSPFAVLPQADRGESAAAEITGRLTVETSMIGALPDPVIMVDEEDRIVYANAATESLLGWTPTELQGRPLITIIPFWFRRTQLVGFEDGTPGGKGRLPGRPLRLTALRSNGTEISVEVRWSEARREDGGLLLMASFCELEVDPERRPAVARDQRLTVLAEAGKVLGASLDYRRTLQDLTEVGLGTLGELCAVGLVEDSGRLRLVAGAHVDPTKRLLLEALCDQPLATCSEIATVVRRGTSRVLEEVDGERLGDVYESDWHRTIVRALQLGPTLIAPLTVRRQTIGGLVFSAPPGAPRYEPADVALAEDLAQRAAIAVDNAGLFTRASEVAHILQHSLLPPRLPRIPGVEIAARYHPAGEYLEVGGDFYDAFSLGRNGWGLLIGDVAGKGPAAAATTALVRHTTRATARRGSRFDVPAAVNDALLEAEDDETFCTMIYGHLRLGDGAPSLDLLNCGHPAPLFMRAEGQIDQVECRGPLLGQFPSTTVDPVALAPLPGDVLVFVTDGVLEARPPRSGPDSRWFGYEGLAAVLRETRGESAGTIAERIEARTVAFSGGSPGDDLAVLVLRFL